MNKYGRQSTIVTEKSKKSKFAILGLGKLSKKTKRQLEEKGIVACEEALPMVLTLRNYRDQWGRMYALKKSWTVGSIVVTKEDVTVFNGGRQIFRHEWSVPAPITCKVSKSKTLKFTIDFSALSGDPRSGKLTTSFSTANAERYKAHFDSCNKQFSAKGGAPPAYTPDYTPAASAAADEGLDYEGLEDDYNYNCYE